MTILYSSTYDDNWTWAEEDVTHAAAEYLDNLTLQEFEKVKVGDKITLYKGERCDYGFKDCLNVHFILEQIAEQAWEDCGDITSGYLDNVTKPQVEELSGLIIDWANRHNLQPNCFLVENISEVEYTITQELLEDITDYENW